MNLYLDLDPKTDTMAADVTAGLRSRPPRLPSKYFYDAHGSELFDRICELDEYYLTRTELSIFASRMQEIARAVGPEAVLIEYGSGNSRKTRTLLRHLERPAIYVPIDISRSHLLDAAARINELFPDLEVLPVYADYSQDIDLGDLIGRRETTAAGDPGTQNGRHCVFFPGSTLGNFAPDGAVAFLKRIRRTVGPRGGLLIGIDLQKDEDTLVAAYDDRDGVTAAFNRNILRHINRKLDTGFDPEAFAHDVRYDNDAHRIEMRLRATKAQTIRVNGDEFRFAPGDSILTEYSHKYDVEAFADWIEGAGFSLQNSWTDPQDRFAVCWCEAR